MYLNFYRLRKQPFHITPDPEFLYLSPSHKEAMSAIIYGVTQRKGFVAIVGAVGSGKTTILRSYLEKTDKKHLKLIYIFNARLTFKELLQTIYQELGLPAKHTEVVEMINGLNEILIEEYKQGNTVVLIVDEAQNIPVDTLENLRMLSNLETSKDKLIQIVLVGQPEFETMINLDRLRQLKQRLAIRSTIRPLTKDESLDYLKFRLKMAGTHPDLVFSPAALRKIVNKANGIPRILNILADNALITGFGYQQRPITAKITKEIIRDLDGTQKKPFFSGRWVPITLVLLFLAIAAGLGLPLKTDIIGKIGTLITLDEKKTVQTTPLKVNTENQPSEEPARITAQQPAKVQKPENVPRKKTVAQGDTLTKLANEVYGKSDNEVFGLIRGKNPQIADPDLIQTGSTIIFPDLPKEETQGVP
jgi:general secretion pathway protein A